jgi:H+-transporting ATPase
MEERNLRRPRRLLIRRTDSGISLDGLTPAKTQPPLAPYGSDETPEEKTNPLLRFLSYFWGPVPWLIEMAAILSALARRWEDSGIIVTLLLVNVHLGFWQEYQAGNIIVTLKEILT